MPFRFLMQVIFLRIQFKRESNEQPTIKIEIAVLLRPGQLANGKVVLAAGAAPAQEEKRRIAPFGKAMLVTCRFPQRLVKRCSRFIGQSRLQIGEAFGRSDAYPALSVGNA